MTMELLYQTDAFEHVTHEHFLCHGFRLPHKLSDFVGDDRRTGPLLMWDAWRLSVA